MAGVLVWENRWAAPFARAARRAGGQLIASGRIPIQAIAASIEAEMALEERELTMPLRPARAARRGVIGAPVARTAATVGVAAVAVHGVRRVATAARTAATIGATAADCTPNLMGRRREGGIPDR